MFKAVSRLVPWGLFLFPLAALAQPAADEAPPLDRRVSIEFPGGPVSQYADTISEQVPDLNLVLSGPARDLELPPIKLNKVSALAAIYLLEQLTANLAEDELSVSEDANLVIVQFMHPRPPRQRQTRVLNVKSLLEQESSLYEAIQFGLEFNGVSEDAVAVKLHEPTGLLFVRGDTEATTLVEQVVAELSGRGGHGLPAGAMGGLGGTWYGGEATTFPGMSGMMGSGGGMGGMSGGGGGTVAPGPPASGYPGARPQTQTPSSTRKKK